MLRDEIITVFGGSGFVGRHVVRALAKAGYRVRVATRRPHLAQDLRVMGVVGQVQLVQANIRVPSSVERALLKARRAWSISSVCLNEKRTPVLRPPACSWAPRQSLELAAAAAGISRIDPGVGALARIRKQRLALCPDQGCRRTRFAS